MRFYKKQHPFYCDIDLHTKKMFLCIVDQQGKILLHRNMQACPQAFLKAIAPYRDDLVRRRCVRLRHILCRPTSRGHTILHSCHPR